MCLQETCEEVAGAGILIFCGSIDIRAEDTDDSLVVIQEIAQHLLGICGGFLLSEAREAEKLLQATHGVVAECTAALGSIVYDLIELLILALKEFMQVHEVVACHIPVIVPGLGVEYELVCEQRIENSGERLEMRLRDTDIGVHDV